ncbi:lytic transglycosylase domain-containing protein [Pseudomaricurvus alkylphenolicus]|uniref:lytic transglycosylase domain-containing protein n=1 Tax=Pseudomaricurvus alkylphenolicus TaxID=1306991 RepID=UPI00141F36F2|nr:lytic transglycosylase domain-containing protein [Pseudomaricurvus alkylphenolicus]NIB41989.1 lytic transglycosylase domain-containing protein [Pseudomaricurvus alkylphenolicus]
MNSSRFSTRLCRPDQLRRLLLVLGLVLFGCTQNTLAQPQQGIDPQLRASLKATIEASDSFEDRYDAEVWLMSKQDKLARFVKSPSERLDLLRRIHRAARRASLQPEIVLALIEVESGFNRFAVSRVGAQGMMQIMPFWKREIGRPDDNLIDIDTNLLYGCTILKHYLDRADGRLIEALARYNGSYGRNTYPRKVMDTWSQHWR